MNLVQPNQLEQTPEADFRKVLSNYGFTWIYVQLIFPMLKNVLFILSQIFLRRV